MKLRTIVLLAVLVCFVALLLVGVAVWSLPPQFQPEAVYQLKYGGLYPAPRPAGDGTLTDFGPRAAIYRYVVDMGNVVYAEQLDKTFLVSDLPAEEFVVGFDVRGGTGSGSLLFERPNIGTVRLEVTTQSGDPVMVEEGPLSDWVWSGPLALHDYAFVYRAGDDYQQPSNGVAKKGRGTRFTPASEESYRIRVRATWQPTTPSRYKIHLLLKGGGWQA